MYLVRTHGVNQWNSKTAYAIEQQQKPSMKYDIHWLNSLLLKCKKPGIGIGTSIISIGISL